MTEKKNEPQKGIWALVSGAGSVLTKDGLVAVILVEKAKLAGKDTTLYESTVYGEPAVVLLRGPSGRWHVTGPVGEVSAEELFRLAEGLRLLAEGRGQSPKK